MERDNDNAPAPNRPADVIRDTNLKASIWRNESDNGPFYATTFTRTYRDKDGQFQDTDSFISTDLLRLSELARKAYERTTEFRREDREQARAQGSGKDARREEFRERRENGAAKDRQETRGR